MPAAVAERQRISIGGHQLMSIGQTVRYVMFHIKHFAYFGHSFHSLVRISADKRLSVSAARRLTRPV
jgi:hypothetical protein